jgi:hypothetical protein
LRNLFRLLGEPLGKLYRTDLRRLRVTRSERVGRADDPLRRVTAELSAQLRTPEPEIFVAAAQPRLLLVEPGDPPAIVVGRELLATPAPAEEARFLLARSLKLLESQMSLPARLSADQLGLLTAGIVRQFVHDFAPPLLPAPALAAETSRVAGVLPRKLRQQLLPFALDCSTVELDYAAVASGARHTGNRVGLLACGDLHSSIRVLRRLAGLGDPAPGQALLDGCRGLTEIDELLAFAVSDEYATLSLKLSSGPPSRPPISP